MCALGIDGAKEQEAPMATILKFRGHQEHDRRKTEPQSRSSAEIIIFPGIRYERWEEEARAVGERGRSAITRDVLTLGD